MDAVTVLIVLFVINLAAGIWNVRRKRYLFSLLNMGAAAFVWCLLLSLIVAGKV